MAAVGVGEWSAQASVVVEVIAAGEDAADLADRVLGAPVDVAAGNSAGLIDAAALIRAEHRITAARSIIRAQRNSEWSAQVAAVEGEVSRASAPTAGAEIVAALENWL